MIRYKFLRFPEGKNRAFTLSFDDGCVQDKRFSDMITELGMKCTFNINSDIMREGRLSKEDIENYFLSRGHEVAIHGYFHRANGSLRPIEGIREVLDCRLELEKRLGIIIRGMAYPDSGITLFENGTKYDQVKNYLSELDIAYARSLGGDNANFRLPSDWHNWIPSIHQGSPKMDEFIESFLNIDFSPSVHRARRVPRLFYLWGHTYEFDVGNGWERIKDILTRLSGHEDIWYATNMEIYEYVEAYKSLIYSADGNIIYNPTFHTIWMDYDCKLYTIAPGQHLVIEE